MESVALFDLSVVLEDDAELVLLEEPVEEEPVPVEALEVVAGFAAGVEDLAGELEDAAGAAGLGGGDGLGALPPPPVLLTLMRLHLPSSVRYRGLARVATR